MFSPDSRHTLLVVSYDQIAGAPVLRPAYPKSAYMSRCKQPLQD